MRLEQGANLPRVKVSNQCAILRVIYNRGPIRRSEIAKSLGLTMPTITGNVNAMIAAGIVHETGPAEPGGGYVGRRAQLVDIVPQSRYFIGAEIKGRERAVCLLDFRGGLVCSARDDTPCRDYVDDIMLTCEMIDRLMAEAGLGIESAAGLGVCLPGLVDSERGVLETLRDLGWRERDVRADIVQCSGYRGPVSVCSSAHARVFGAQLLQRELVDRAETFAYLLVSDGVDCPFVINGSGSFGPAAGAGEIGHMVMEPDGVECVCGSRGCLEAYSGDRAVRAACASALAEGRAAGLRAMFVRGEPVMEEVLRAQAGGDPDVTEIVARAVRTLAAAVSNVSRLICPGLMMIEGELFRREENRDALLEAIRRNMRDVTRARTRYSFVEPDGMSGARGAAAMAIFRELALGMEM